jgi:hypothetical protein
MALALARALERSVWARDGRDETNVRVSLRPARTIGARRSWANGRGAADTGHDEVRPPPSALAARVERRATNLAVRQRQTMHGARLAPDLGAPLPLPPFPSSELNLNRNPARYR